MEEAGGWTQTIWLLSKSKQLSPAKMLIDSQLTFGNLISSRFIEELGLETEPCSEQWESIDGSLIIAKQKIHLWFEGNSKSSSYYQDKFFVVDMKYDVLVGQTWMNRHPEIISKPRALVLIHKKLTKEEEAKIVQNKEKQGRESEQFSLLRQQNHQQRMQSERPKEHQQQQTWTAQN